MMVRYLAALLGAVAMLSGCGFQEAVDGAQEEVALFHSRLDAADYDAIWAESDPRLHAASPKEDFGSFLAMVHAKLGKVENSEQTGWKVNTTTGGAMVTVANTTEFEKGSAQETFVFSGDGDDLRLLTYNINSRALIMNSAPAEEPAKADEEVTES